MSAEENKALVRRFFEEYNKGKAAAMTAMDETYANDVIGHALGGEEISGLKGFKQYMNEIFNAVPDIHGTIEDMIAEGNKVAVRATMTGTHKDEFMDSARGIEIHTQLEVGSEFLVSQSAR